MRSSLVIHEPVREYVYPVTRNRLTFILKCGREQGGNFFVYYCNRFHNDGFANAELICTARDGEFAYFTGTIEVDEVARYLRYYFQLKYADGEMFYGADGIESAVPVRCFEYLYTNENDVFTVPEWAAGAVFYQIFPERFNNGDPANDPEGCEGWNITPNRTNFAGGDLRGIISRLDYLENLGIEAIYLNPVFKSRSNHKYDTEDYYEIDPAFGNINDLRELVSQSHARGIKIVLDGVFNHCGYWFAPFQDVLAKGAGSRYADWFMIDRFPVETDPPNYECVGYYKWMPKTRMSNRAVREYFLAVGTWWIRETGIDGWRLDVADEVDFTFWQEFRRAIKAEKSDALLIGETWKDGRDMLRGDQMDSVMNYLFRDAMIGYFAERRMSERQFDERIQKILSIYPQMVNPVLFNLLGSHDTARFLTVCGGETWKMKLAVAFQMAFPGMPAIYYGDELAMLGDNDPGCRAPMAWPQGDSDMHAHFRQLISIRRQTPALRLGSFHSIACQDGIYAFARRLADETVYAVFNISESNHHIRIPLFAADPVVSLVCPGSPLNVLEDEPDDAYNSDINKYRASIEMELPAHHFDILKQGGQKE